MFLSVWGYCHKRENHQDKTRTNVNLVPNLDHKTKKTRTKTWHVQNKIPTWFYYKKEIKTKQTCDKKKPKIGVEHIEDNGKFYFNLQPLGT